MGVGENEINTQNPNKLLEMGDARKGLGLEEQGRDNLQASSPGRNPLGSREQEQHPGKGLETPSAGASRELPELCSQQDTGNAVGDRGVLALTGLFSGFRRALG